MDTDLIGLISFTLGNTVLKLNIMAFKIFQTSYDSILYVHDNGKINFFKLYRRLLFMNESERLPLINKRLEETRRDKFVPDSKLLVLSNNK